MMQIVSRKIFLAKRRNLLRVNVYGVNLKSDVSLRDVGLEIAFLLEFHMNN